MCDVHNLAEIEKEAVGFPESVSPCGKGIYIRWQQPYFSFIYTVQHYKKVVNLANTLGCRAVALPSTEQIFAPLPRKCPPS